MASFVPKSSGTIVDNGDVAPDTLTSLLPLAGIQDHGLVEYSHDYSIRKMETGFGNRIWQPNRLLLLTK
jgi:hypothetical protein